ncbi:MAG: cheB [Frankiales bacterium]|nr:cheB [Frankiales bacterium]
MSLSALPVPARDVLVVGGSAGGVDALKRFLAGLPDDLDAAVCVALHLGSTSPSLLPGILARVCGLQVVAAVDGAALERGVVHVARPDVHLVVAHGLVRLGPGPRENGHRPSLDVLLRSAALAYGPRAVGVVLTGMLDDGAAGLHRIAAYGGASLVQDPDDAEFPSMPRAALAAVPSARRAPLAALSQEAVSAVDADRYDRPEPTPRERRRDEAEVRSALGLDPALADGQSVGRPSPYSCPDCGGVLNGVEDAEGLLRFRCRVGHAYTAQTLVEAQGDTVEDALFTALRALEERGEVAERLARTSTERGREYSGSHFRRRAEQARNAAEVLRQVLAEHRSAAQAAADHTLGETGT